MGNVEQEKIAADQLLAITKLFTPSGMFQDVRKVKEQLDRETDALQSQSNVLSQLNRLGDKLEWSLELLDVFSILKFPELERQLELAINDLLALSEPLELKRNKQKQVVSEIQSRFFSICKDNDNQFDRIKDIIDITSDD